MSQLVKKINLLLLCIILASNFGYTQTYNSSGTTSIATNGVDYFNDINVSGIGVINVGGAELSNITIDITHTYDSDLDIYLVAPDASIVELSTDNGGSGDNYTNTIFSDAGAMSCFGQSAPFTATYKPEIGTLGTLNNGQNADGVWSLKVFDDAIGDVGTINSWSITFIPAPSCIIPSVLTVSGIAATSANLGWTENGTASTWDIELGATGFSPTGTPTSNNVTSNPYLNSGLSPSTSYDFYVRADCGGLQSNWIGPLNFSTVACNLQTPTALSVTPGANTANLSWAENGNSTTWDIAVGVVGFAPTGPIGNGNDVTLNTNFTYSGGLAQGTTYDWYVRSVCDGVNGTWSIGGTFTTIIVSVESFVKTMNPAGWDDQAESVVYDANDDSYVWAGYSSDAAFTSGSYDFYVVKTDIEGVVIWTKFIGNSGTEKAFDIVTSHDGGYVILGTTNSTNLIASGSNYDVMVTKLDASGNHIWTTVLGTDYNDLNNDCSIIRSSDNGFAIAATVAQYSTSSKKAVHFYKLDASGNLIATREIDATPGSSSSDTEGVGDIIQSSDGGFVIAGHTGFEFFVAKLNSDLTHDWSLEWTAGTASEEIHAIIENSPNDYTVLGETWAQGPGTPSTSSNMYAMRFTYDGTGSPTVDWSETIGTGGPATAYLDICYDAVASGDGGYVLAGYTDVDGSSFRLDTYLVKLNSSGGLVWETLIENDGTNHRQANGIIRDSYGGFAVAARGSFEMIRVDGSGSNCESTAHTGIVTPVSSGTFTIEPDVFSSTTTRTVSSVSRTPSQGSGGIIVDSCYTPSALPIKLGDFNSDCINGERQINWTTITEENNDYFTLERSVDGEEFEIVRTVDGAGNSLQQIQYSISDDVGYQIVYYRLKQTDFDGMYTYSKIIGSECNSGFSVYPNPARNVVIVESDKSQKIISVSIINALGEIVNQLQNSGDLKLRFNTEELKNGIYFVEVILENERIVRKLVISK